jgi:hypothetical protein
MAIFALTLSAASEARTNRTPPLHQVGKSGAALVASDDRYVLYLNPRDDPAHPHVLDSLTRATGSVSIPTGCQVSGMARGAVVLTCASGDAAGRIRILAVSTNSTSSVPVDSDAEGQDAVMRAYFDRFGHDWVEGKIACGGCGGPATTFVYVNRTTGEVRRYNENEQPEHGRNLDSPTLDAVPATICGVHNPLGYRAPYVLSYGGRGLLLRRCTSPRHSTAIKCRRCVGPQLWAGTVTWHDGPLKAYVIRTRATYAWRIRASTAEIFATRFAAYVTARGRLWEAVFPRR